MPLVVTYVESWSIELVLVRFIWAFVVRFYPQNIEYINSLQIAWFQLFDFVNYILCFFLCNFTSHGICRYIIFNIFFFVHCVGQPKPVLTRCWTFNINPSKHSSWRGLSSSSSKDVFKTSEYVLVKANIFALAINLQKTSSRRLGQDQFLLVIPLQDVFKKSLQNILKTFWSPQDVLQKRLQGIFKTSSKLLQGILQKRLQNFFQDMFKASCKVVFKVFSRRIIKLNCSC